MSSFFSQASFVMDPSVYRAGTLFVPKPTDGSGDLNVTRSNDTATRVGPDGLIEKVRTNLVLQSNSFDTTWTNTNTTETSGQAGYDGTNNAWLLDSTGGFIQQNISLNGLYTFSVYAKKGTAEGIRLRINAGTDANCYINLNDGTEINAHSGVYLSVVSVGSGWYRIGLAINDSAIVDVRFYPVNLSGFSTTGNILIQDAMLEVGDVMTDYIQTTTTAVSVGPVANVPRLDYFNSNCPRLLLEPQRTNNAQFSEQFDNAYWAKSNATVTSTLGGPIDQSKYFTITCNGATGAFKGIKKDWINAAPNTYTLSVFAKSGTSSTFVVSSRATLTSNDTRAIFNLANGTITNVNGGTATIVPYADGWYRCSFTVVNSGTYSDQASMFFGHPHGAADGATVLATGAMSEIGAYATSYIPTLGSASTRGIDAASKTGISSLIGQTQGTLFFEINDLQNFYAYLGVDNVSSGTRILIYGIGDQKVYTQVRNGSTIIFSAQSAAISGAAKAAVAFNSSGSVFYVNGVQVATGSGTTYTNLSQLTFNHTSQVGAILNQALLFKTRLPNSELAKLTSL